MNDRLEIPLGFLGKDIFLDGNKDGYPDDLGLVVLVPPGLEDPWVWTGILNLTARLAFEVTALRLPLVKVGLRSAIPGQALIVLSPGQKPAAKKGGLVSAELWRRGPRLTYISGTSAEAMMGLLNAMSMAKGGIPAPTGWEVVRLPSEESRHLECMDKKGRLIRSYALSPRFGGRRPVSKVEGKDSSSIDLLNPCGIFEIPSNNPKARRLKACFSLPSDKISPELGLTLCECVARLALDATEITLPIAYVGKTPGQGLTIRIRENVGGATEFRLCKGSAGEWGLLVQGGAQSLAKALRDWFAWAFIEGGPGFEKVDALRNHVTELRDLLCGKGQWGRWARVLEKKAESNDVILPHVSSQQQKRIAKACKALSVHAPALAPRPQTLKLQTRWKSETEEILKLATTVPRGRGVIWGEIFVSKPLQVRKRLKSGLERIIRTRGYEQPRLKVLNAYKPGLSWMMEEVLPRLKALPSVSSLEVRYRPFTPAARSLEMKSRWLQEVFPGPDLLALALGLDPPRIRTRMRDGMDAVYEVWALDHEGRLVFKQDLSPRWSKLAYLGTEPDQRFVHPTTGGVRLWQEDRVIMDQAVATDRERFWRQFQLEWVPALKRLMLSRIEKESFEGQPAFWEEILLQVSIDESEVRLPIGEERISPMEALHEDIYFVLLDFFSGFAAEHKLPSHLQLGRIVPKVIPRTTDGIPQARFTAVPLPWSQSPKGTRQARPAEPFVSAMSLQDDRWKLEIRGSCSDALLTICRAWGFDLRRGEKKGLNLFVRTPRVGNGSSRKRPSHSENPPPRDRLIKATQVTRWIKRLGIHSNIDAWQVSRSLQGRPLWVLEATLKAGGRLLSHTKTRFLKPTLFFNARHHANEISSTNATIFMAWLLGRTGEAEELLRHVNVAWIPVENPDGVATFEELLPSCSGHKLHAARYNALGAEYYADYFESNPRFPEALAKARLWRRWLPEIMVDHHGVPSHEWDQPFSGYAPHRFREFWIPRNFVYACIPFVNEPDHPSHGFSMHLARVLRRAMAQEKGIAQLNRELSSRYQRYARGPEPETFPASRGEPLLVVPPLERTYRNNFAVRFPKITLSEVIIEVPDEVAYGRHLELCVQAHLRIEETLIKTLRRSKGRITRSLDPETGLLLLCWEPGRLLLKSSA